MKHAARQRTFYFVLLTALCATALCHVNSATAQPSTPIPRKILTFYEDALLGDPVYNRVHRMAEMPLNHLGLDVVYHPLSAPLPERLDPAQYRGIVTWFHDATIMAPNPRAYCAWLEKHIAAGIKTAILGWPGFPLTESMMPAACARVLNAIGVRVRGTDYNNPFFLEVASKDAPMVEYERAINFFDDLHHNLIQPISPDVVSHLVVRRTDMSDGDGAMVVTSPRGAYVYPGYAIYQQDWLRLSQWRLNPFLFFETVFQTRGLPRPDTTTLNGARIFYSHIDNDGFFSISEIDHKRYTGEVIYQEILKAYSNLPITVSMITGYLTLPRYMTRRNIELINSIFNLPNVEPASHTHSHPFRWIETHRQQSADDPTRYRQDIGHVDDGSIHLPDYTFDARAETVGSLDVLNDYLSRHQIPKTASLLQWSGDCIPGADAIAALDAAGLPNINGGETRFDSEKPSLTGLWPIGIRRGGRLQIYASNSNENIYTRGWTGPYFAFRYVIDTFKKTEQPVRLKPINVYYHFFIGERPDALKSLKDVYDYAADEPIFPMFASEYARLARDFYSAKISRAADGAFHIAHEGALRTIRFDDETRRPDMARSRGLIGYRHFQNSLYVFLDQSTAHTIYLTDKDIRRPHWKSATFWINDFEIDAGEISFTMRGWHIFQGTLADLTPNRAYEIVLPDRILLLQSDDSGTLALKFDDIQQFNADIPVRVKERRP